MEDLALAPSPRRHARFRVGASRARSPRAPADTRRMHISPNDEVPRVANGGRFVIRGRKSGVLLSSPVPFAPDCAGRRGHGDCDRCHVQYARLVDARQVPESGRSPARVEILCAWCKSALGTKWWNNTCRSRPPIVSHGICLECQAQYFGDHTPHAEHPYSA
jgi:hypothetical protein